MGTSTVHVPELPPLGVSEAEVGKQRGQIEELGLFLGLGKPPASGVSELVQQARNATQRT